MGSQLFNCKSIDQLLSDSENAEVKLKKSLGWISLTSLGIGAVIGSGIFTIVGTAIAGQKLQVASILNAPLLEYLIYHSASFGRPGAGPAIALSFVLVAVVCGFASVCYAELAAMIPIAGSAYTYTYATMGELIAWIIGWDLILEYAVSNMAVSVGFSQHIVNLLDWFGLHPDPRWISPAYLPGGLSDLEGNILYAPGWHLGFNWPAFIIVMILTVILVRGIRESAETNNIMVLLKIVAILVFIGFASRFIHPANWHPFAPNGWPGVLTGGSIVFFTYIGFDSVSTAAEECKNPQRDVPIGIIATLIICTLLYIGVVVVLTGLVPWQTLVDDAAPVVNTLEEASLHGRPPSRPARRTDGHDLFAARVPTRTSARVVRHVARWPAAAHLQPRTSAILHSGLFHVDGGLRRGNSRGTSGHRHTRRSFEHRHAVRIRAGRWRRVDPSLSRTESQARVPRAGRSAGAYHYDYHVSPADGGLADYQLDSILRVDGNWSHVLLQLWPQAQHIARRETRLGELWKLLR